MRAITLVLCVCAFAQANTIQIHDNYQRAHALALDPATKKPLLVFAQKDGQPAVPSDERFQIDLSSFVVVAIPTDYEWASGSKLLEDEAFNVLQRGPGIVRFDLREEKLIRTAHTVGTDVPLGTLLARIMGASYVRTVPAVMPEFADAHLNEIVRDPETYWYDKRTMPPVYQDGVGPYQGILTLDQPYGDGPIFDKQSGGFQYPFKVTAGTDHSSVKVVDFIWRPRKSENSDERWPIAIYRKSTGNHLDMIYPAGAVVGEVIYIKAKDGTPYVVEVRTRTRELDHWSPNAYRPFPESQDLVAAIEEHYPNWKEIPSLAKIVEHLRSDSVVPLTLRGRGVLNAVGGVVTVPEMEDAHVEHLLRHVTFKPSDGRIFKQNTGGNQAVAYAASSGNDKFHVFPDNYTAGAVMVDSQSCMQCHDQIGRNIAAFGGNSIQGDIWGFDGIFSFHPFRREVIVNNPQSWPSNPLRKDFLETGFIAQYNQSEHPASVYQRILHPWQKNR